MADTSQEIVRHPRPFTDTLVALRYGQTHDELTDALNELVNRCTNTNKAGKLVLTLSLKPGKGGQLEITDDMKLTLPKEDRASTIMFATPEHNLQREDPRQRPLEGIRSVDQEVREVRKVGA